MSVIDIVFKGRPITKKNHGQIVKNGNKRGYIRIMDRKNKVLEALLK